MVWTVYIELHLIGIHLQDDYPDCFGDPEFIGKISTCSFFVTNLILVLLCSSLRPMLYFF